MPDSKWVGIGMSWCGASVSLADTVPYLPRCGTCLTRVAKYVKEVSGEVPTRVVTTIRITVEHNATETDEQVLSTAMHRIRPKAATSWEISNGEILSSLPKGT